MFAASLFSAKGFWRFGKHGGREFLRIRARDRGGSHRWLQAVIIYSARACCELKGGGGGLSEVVAARPGPHVHLSRREMVLPQVPPPAPPPLSSLAVCGVCGCHQK